MVPQAGITIVCSVFRIRLHMSYAVQWAHLIAVLHPKLEKRCICIWTTNRVRNHSCDIQVTNTSTSIVSSWVHRWPHSGSNLAFFRSCSAQSLIYEDCNSTRAFRVAASTIWSNLPITVNISTSLYKGHLFSLAFAWSPWLPGAFVSLLITRTTRRLCIIGATINELRRRLKIWHWLIDWLIDWTQYMPKQDDCSA